MAIQFHSPSHQWPVTGRLGLLLGLTLLLPACGPKLGPRPVLTKLKISAANSSGVITIWGRIQNNFKDAKPTATPAQLMDKLNEEVTFEIEGAGAREKYVPSFVPSLAETIKTTDEVWKDQISVDFLLFPEGVGGRSFKLIPTNFFDERGLDPLTFELESPGSYGSFPRVTSIEVEPAKAKGKQKITAILDRDVPETMTVWHHLDGRVVPMDRKGSRIFAREFKETDRKDHKVLLMSRDEWISPPAVPGAGSVESATEEDSEERSE